MNMLSSYRLRNTLIAGGLALVGAILVFVYIAGYRKNLQSGADLVKVYVAGRDIPAGMDGASASGGGYLNRQSVLRRNVVQGAISNPSQIAGLAAAQTILAGQEITLRQFRPVAEQGVLASISGNLRAMRLPGDANELLAGIVKDGDHVDVIANIKYVLKTPGSASASSGGNLNLVASRVILRDLLVLRAPTAKSTTGIGGTQPNDSSITLALTDSQAQKLLFALKNGDWWLALRPLAKPTDSPDSVETMQSILGDGLGASQVGQLTDGLGKGSISGGG